MSRVHARFEIVSPAGPVLNTAYRRQGKVIVSQATVSFVTIAGMNLGMFTDLRADHCVFLHVVIVSKIPS